MKILFITRSMPVHATGGMEQHAKALIDYLAELNKITVITTFHPGNISEEKEGNICTFYLKNTRPGKYYGGWKKAVVSFLSDHLNKEKYDVLISESVSAYPYYTLPRRGETLPCIAFIHGTVAKEIKTIFRKKITLKKMKEQLI